MIMIGRLSIRVSLSLLDTVSIDMFKGRGITLHGRLISQGRWIPIDGRIGLEDVLYILQKVSRSPA